MIKGPAVNIKCTILCDVNRVSSIQMSLLISLDMFFKKPSVSGCNWPFSAESDCEAAQWQLGKGMENAQ